MSAKMKWSVESAARVLLDAEETRTDRHPITEEWPELDLKTAYQIQDELIKLKVATGQHVVGAKLGLTSRAKQLRMGIDSPLTAWLTDAMNLPAGVPIPTTELIHPRVEPEIVFVLGRDLAGPGLTAAQALAAVDAVYAGLEIIDSRFIDFKFALPDVVADNASSSRFVLGARKCRPEDLDLALEACVLQVDGEVVFTATGAAVQGHPAEALALAANSLGRRGVVLRAGWIVLTGGLTDAVFIRPGQQVSAEFTSLGTVAVGAV
jgi:2-oxo-3-hexenedioate decarboxylase